MSLLDSAIQLWIARQQLNQANKDPKAIIAPPTPQETWITDVMKNFLENGSPNRNFVTDYAKQALSGHQNLTPNLKFASPQMQGQQFAGGITLPKIDMSAYMGGGKGTIGGGAGTGPTPTTVPAGPPSPGGDGGGGGTVQSGPPAAGGGIGAGGTDDPFSGMPENTRPGNWADMVNWWKNNKGWAKPVLDLLVGKNPGTSLFDLAKNIYDRFHPASTEPGGGGGGRGGPGNKGGGGPGGGTTGPEYTPPGIDSGSGVIKGGSVGMSPGYYDPKTGKWIPLF